MKTVAQGAVESGAAPEFAGHGAARRVTVQAYGAVGHQDLAGCMGIRGSYMALKAVDGPMHRVVKVSVLEPDLRNIGRHNAPRFFVR